MMYTASPQKYISKSTPTKLNKKIKLLQQSQETKQSYE